MNHGVKIFLVGMPGSGKSTVGKVLAHSLQAPFQDMDALIVQETGQSIAQIFETQGEGHFRELEHQLLKKFVEKDGPAIISTGGGVVVRKDNRALLKSMPRVIYLQTPPQILFSRTHSDRNRPLLQTNDPRKTLDDLFMLRDPWYLEVSKLVLPTQDIPPALLIESVFAWLEK